MAMSSQHLEQDEFFDRLGDLFNGRKGSEHGAIYLTQKRLSYGQDISPATTSDPLSDLHPGKPLPIIVRVTDGKSKKERPFKVKLSTVVQPHELEAFYARYADICKVGMTALKPRDRSKKKAKAKKKKATS